MDSTKTIRKCKPQDKHNKTFTFVMHVYHLGFRKIAISLVAHHLVQSTLDRGDVGHETVANLTPPSLLF